MKHLLFLPGLLLLFLVCSPAKAQVSSAVVVSACAAPPVTYTPGQSYPLTQDTTGVLCTPGGGGGSSNVVVTSGNLTADTHAQCAALCANLVVKASAGRLKTFEVSADSTLSGAIWYVIVYDATTAPGDGAVTPAKCYQQTSGTTQMGGTLSTGGSSFTTGIVIGVSSTGCFTKTASTHAYIAADFQ